MTEPHPLLSLLRTQPVGALGTVQGGEPFVSMVPFALVPSQAVLAIHVSQLAQHTRHMLANPAVSLMVVAPLAAGASALALPRATLQCQAQPCGADAPGHAQARAAYLARFPESEELFSFADFSLFTLVPQQARWVGGFAQARSLNQPELALALGQADTETGV
jgi:putative heme iron utilization protein